MIGAMNLRTFLLVDSLLLDIAAIAAVIAGEGALGGALFAAAAVVFIVWLALGARGRQAGATT